MKHCNYLVGFNRPTTRYEFTVEYLIDRINNFPMRVYRTLWSWKADTITEPLPTIIIL